ncbi:MAG TPA: maleylacetoacetate isomerase [Polyangiaceae bacterium LLY-WYZ-15_(1-7)]|nr:maleylacetoacetate isomerase [Polyangiaceae bacterium LLY-WYZ-15_(1-7)]HJL09454.1 maleylacetoacetate isomerase [Polyangiaceae bacterium LLY-WYZ-15_(1-7)]HJL24617.1 maleylacetoacetate isomerase [Polyangiaceae bacterium LLY-WYZ-15_(1-7)]HJL32570.1 maleylacetoacetate isomerase [Polyangiaceae bacterium LLY-WYZ-15_(1-7)]HJL37033.1 maleylacetoacetate isomerase [Polyangiaceae bacterium LLY-WYZ-15_(1-7)]
MSEAESGALPPLRLYAYWRSSCSWRVRIALEHKGLAYEVRSIHLREGEQRSDDYAGVNTLQQVPVLEWEEGALTRRLTQSLAILHFLEDAYPEKALVPADAWARARAWEHAEIVNAGIQPLQNFATLLLVDSLGGDKVAHARGVIAKGLGAMEKLAKETAGAYLVGDRPSVADVCLVPQLYNARRFDVDVDAYPTLLRAEARCASLPAFQAAHPDRQPDAPSAEPS